MLNCPMTRRNVWKAGFVCALMVCGSGANADTKPEFTSLYSFTGGVDGGNPYGNLIQAADGNFYGTSWQGGNYTQSGTIIKMTPEGVVTTLYALESVPGVINDGDHSRAPLVQGSDGDFYGTAASGGEYDDGTIFKITSTGAFTTLYSFANRADGRAPLGGLVEGGDGNFYGMTYGGGGGEANYGTVFKISPQGAFAVLHIFAGGEDGRNPELTGLVRGRDGNFYGTTPSGGTYDDGTVFKMTPDGVLTVIHAFNFLFEGETPYGGLVAGDDGNFYGTTIAGGNGNGTVFKITPEGELTTLYEFSAGDDGSAPSGRLIQGSDGNLYGTTQDPWHFGTVFKITPSGGLTTLHSFNGEDGQTLYAGLVEGSDGSLYGMANFGGIYNAGTIFKLSGVIESRGSDGGGTGGSGGGGSLSPVFLILGGLIILIGRAWRNDQM